MHCSIAAFYTFTPLPATGLKKMQEDLTACGTRYSMGGLTIIGEEGINGTVAGSAESITAWMTMIERIVGKIPFQVSEAPQQPFKRFLVKIREEIVSLGNPKIVPEGKRNHLSPEEWDVMMEQEDVVIVDARNTYETAIGMFEGAIDPGLMKFQDFPAWVKHSALPKDKKILLYCTGGIRCEKACLAMEQQGYSNVFQLDGGILRYLATKPASKWTGECFVFDHRVSVGSGLKPSERYTLCPHCGDPGDREIVCAYCGSEGQICSQCLQAGDQRSCSKNCSHHLIRGTKKHTVLR